ncbi:ribosome biogenesis regulatory protein, putative [Eimeria maxima]|uniref:Ribosome biogenesis regulatory protein, putative n=1 Tax=Eimeria maxima TaxID=5804 RepID=U6M7R6_EIMMA|nr:ribosome biogenesis regulatory protein, putative [Eimeria maxima]CDJ57715.1 ribosome biogenesis regulatory protein, putative [Eimeria maxima]
MESSTPVRVDLSTLGPGLPESTGAADPLTYHLHHLIATDLSPLEATTDLEEKTRESAEYFVRKLFSLDHHQSEDGVSLQLVP